MPKKMGDQVENYIGFWKKLIFISVLSSELLTDLLFWPMLSLLPFTTEDYPPWGGNTHSRLGPPTSFNNKENTSQICSLPHTNPKRKFFS